MANETKRIYGSSINLQTFTSVTVGTFEFFATGTNNLLLTNDPGFPYVIFHGTLDYKGTPSINAGLDIYARPLNVIGSNDAPAPSADYTSMYLCRINMELTGAAQYFTQQTEVVHRPNFDCTIYVYNINESRFDDWSLSCTPWTYEISQ